MKSTKKTIFFSTALLLISLASCKGRTADNVVPTGDTVEVEVTLPASTESEQPTDSSCNTDDEEFDINDVPA